MKRSRQILVLTLVATALCADRVVSAAPQQCGPSPVATADPIARLATNLASRMFAGSFRRQPPGVRLERTRHQSEVPLATVPADSTTETPVIHVAQVTPFQFRLPPPAL